MVFFPDRQAFDFIFLACIYFFFRQALKHTQAVEVDSNFGVLRPASCFDLLWIPRLDARLHLVPRGCCAIYRAASSGGVDLNDHSVDLVG
jgi:hypothetical protein